ncbi:hypothetical protein ACFSKL_12840 [Belliella marina]|uniref:SH3 domain-containing protein n=1 Tax=Belliella marina TaxID=1644146 RepID=A0ABW4VQU6_9BACT
MKTIYLYFIILFMGFGTLYGQDQELSEEQYAILNLELIDGLVYEQTIFAFYWHNYLTSEWLGEQNGTCNQGNNSFKTSEISKHIEEETLIKLKNSLKNESKARVLSPHMLLSDQVKLVSDYGSIDVRRVSSPVIEGDIAILIIKEKGVWIEKINFYKKNNKGIWEKFCGVDILESTGTKGISYLN